MKDRMNEQFRHLLLFLGFFILFIHRSVSLLCVALFLNIFVAVVVVAVVAVSVFLSYPIGWRLRVHFTLFYISIQVFHYLRFYRESLSFHMPYFPLQTVKSSSYCSLCLLFIHTSDSTSFVNLN